MEQAKKKVGTSGIVFAFVVALGSSLFLVPAFIIQPFRSQSTQALELALALRQYAPLWTLVAAIVAVSLAFWIWERAGRTQRAFLVLGVLLVAASATMARLNYFEWMFHPVAQPGFEAADRSKLDTSEMVLAVTFNNDARAYPIREMAYHHIVNDVVGGVPVAVTY